MPTLLRLGLMPIALVTLIGAAACGGDDDDATDDTATAEATATATEDSDSNDRTSTPRGTANGSDDSSADLQDYFDGVSEIAIRTDTTLEGIGSDLQSATFANDAAEIEATRTAFQQAGETLELAILDFADLDPPDEAADAHAEFIDKLQAALAVQSQFLADMDDVTTSDELDALADDYSPDLTESDSAFDEACLALQQIADDNGAEADLRCTD